MKKIIILLIIIMVLTASFLLINKFIISDDRVVITVDNYPVTLAERGTKSTDAIVKIKIEQILMLEKNITADISYKTFLKEFNAENKRRALMLKNNQVIYGAQQYNETTYYDILHAQRIEELKNIYRNEFKAEDGQISDYYNKTVENYRLPANIKVLKISDTNKSKVSEMNFSHDGELLIFDSETNRSDLRTQSLVFSAANKLKVNEASEILFENGKFVKLLCIERNEGELLSLEQVRSYIENILFEEYFENIIMRRLSEAVIINKTGD